MPLLIVVLILAVLDLEQIRFLIVVVVLLLLRAPRHSFGGL